MKKLTATQVNFLVDMSRFPQNIDNTRKLAMKTCKALADNGFCTGTPYSSNYRQALYRDGVRFEITRKGVDAIRLYGDEKTVEAFNSSVRTRIENARKTLADLESKIAELKLTIELYEEKPS